MIRTLCPHVLQQKRGKRQDFSCAFFNASLALLPGAEAEFMVFWNGRSKGRVIHRAW